MKKLYKSEDNKVLCGVCGGLGEFLGIDPTIVRLIWVVLALAAGSTTIVRLIWVVLALAAGSGLLIYILAAIIMPRRPLD